MTQAVDLGTVTVADLERDPYPIYSYLRETEPVAYMPCLDVWMVTRWEDVEAACFDTERFPAHVEGSPTDRALGGVSMMTTDGGLARQRRRPFDPTFRPSAVEAAMPDVFDRLCEEHLGEIARRGRAELVADYFEPISLLSLAEAVGIGDLVDLETLRRWFSGLAAGVSNYEGDPDKAALSRSVSDEIDDALTPRFEAVLEHPDDSLLSNLVHAFPGSLEERLAWIMPSVKLVLLGGLQEPGHGGATITQSLLAHPAQHAAVSGDPGLVAAAVDEGLRWTAPIGNLLRGVKPGTTVGDVGFPMVRASSSLSHRQTVTKSSGVPQRVNSTSIDPSSDTSRLRWAPTTASVTTSPGCSWRPQSASSSTNSRGCASTRITNRSIGATSTDRRSRCAFWSSNGSCDPVSACAIISTYVCT